MNERPLLVSLHYSVYMSRKGRTERCGWVHHQAKKAWATWL